MNTHPTAIQRLYLIRVAVAPSPTNPALQVPIVCYLIQTNDGKNILIDTGLGDVPPGMLREDSRNVIEQLETIGLKPEDINIVVGTHFDRDHAGRFGAFPNAKLVVQQSHHEHAHTSPRFEPTRSQWDLPRDRYHFVEGDMELVAGLELIETNGHTRGHQSVLVRLPHTGVVVLAIDAVPNKNAYVLERISSPVNEDADAVLASTKKLMDIVEREHAALVVFGHDLDQWEGLKRLPEYYD